MTSRTAVVILATLLLVLSTGAYVGWSVRDGRLRSTGAYALAMDRVASDVTIGEALGRPISRGIWVEAEQGDYLTLRIPLRGTHESGSIELVSDVDGTDIEAMVLTTGGTRVDLLAGDAERLQSHSVLEAWTAGAELLERGQYAEAVTALSEAIELDETMANAWFLRGRARLGLGELEAAEADMHEAARLDPADPEIPMLLGQLYSNNRRYVECVTAYTEVLSIDAESGTAWLFRARCYEKLRDYRRALAGAREACSAGIAEGCEMQERLKGDRYESTVLK
jgi:tetratricopeptide (TPR) repeat protein